MKWNITGFQPCICQRNVSLCAYIFMKSSLGYSYGTDLLLLKCVVVTCICCLECWIWPKTCWTVSFLNVSSESKDTNQLLVCYIKEQGFSIFNTQEARCDIPRWCISAVWWERLEEDNQRLSSIGKENKRWLHRYTNMTWVVPNITTENNCLLDIWWESLAWKSQTISNQSYLVIIPSKAWKIQRNIP